MDEKYHCVLKGNPGTGKTTVALCIGAMLKAAGILDRAAPCIEMKASDTQGAYLGEAIKETSAKIDAARGGLLFVDEAHQLTEHKDNQYGKQAATTLMNCLQDKDKRVIAIFAGYRDKMTAFMQVDEGFTRRIGRVFDLPDYTPKQLVDIFIKKAEMKRRGLDLSPENKQQLAMLIDRKWNPELRSELNGSIAEALLTYADRKMRDRLRPNLSDPTITWADITGGLNAIVVSGQVSEEEDQVEESS